MKRWAISPPQPGPLARPDDSTYFKLTLISYFRKSKWKNMLKVHHNQGLSLRWFNESTYFKDRRKAEMSKRRMSQVIRAKVLFIDERKIQKLDVLKVGNNCQKNLRQLWYKYETTLRQIETTLGQFGTTLNTLRQLGDSFLKTLGQLGDSSGTLWRLLSGCRQSLPLPSGQYIAIFKLRWEGRIQI